MSYKFEEHLLLQYYVTLSHFENILLSISKIILIMGKFVLIIHHCTSLIYTYDIYTYELPLTINTIDCSLAGWHKIFTSGRWQCDMTTRNYNVI